MATTPCTNPAHGVKSHVVGTKAANKCAASSSATSQAPDAKPVTMTPAARPVEPESEDEGEPEVEVDTEQASEYPEVKAYLVRVQRALVASAEKQEWDQGLDRRSASRHRVAAFMTDFISSGERRFTGYFNVASHIKNVMNRNGSYHREVAQSEARRKQERVQRDALILKAAQEAAQMPEAPNHWSMENVKNLIGTNSGNRRK